MSDAHLVFVGGTGRSGTHVVANILGHHSRFYMVPIECRFHCNPGGLADVVDGRTSPKDFTRKLRGFWWRRARLGERVLVGRRALVGRRVAEASDDGKVRGLHKIVPRERLEAAAKAFEAGAGEDPVAASRELFFDLLAPLAAEAGKPSLVEMSCFTIAAAPALSRIFPEARFIHAVRDGRDSGASKVSKRQKAHHPRDVREGIDWWEGRLRTAEAGVRELEDPSCLLTVGLDELVHGDREAAYASVLGFLEIEDEPAMREFFDTEVSADAAHRERWREGLDAGEQAELTTAYEDMLGRLEADGATAAPVLRRVLERA
jgi:sulfotransferase family protein